MRQKKIVIGYIGHVNIEIVSLFFGNFQLCLYTQSILIGCSTLRQGYCKLIGLYWILMRRQLWTLKCCIACTGMIMEWAVKTASHEPSHQWFRIFARIKMLDHTKPLSNQTRSIVWSQWLWTEGEGKPSSLFISHRSDISEINPNVVLLIKLPYSR